MQIQIEQRGDYFYARLRTRETVYLWAVFLSEMDARQWAQANFDTAVLMMNKLAA